MAGAESAAVVVVQEDWLKELEFLRHYGMYDAYVYLLSLANNRRHLNRLFVDCLSDNCRVLRDDWVRIEKAWHKVPVKGAGVTHPPEFIRKILEKMCPPLGLAGAGYYTNALLKETGYMSKSLWQLRHVRNSKKDEHSPGLNFWVTLFRRDFPLGCWVDPKNLQGIAYAAIAIARNELTEPLTHQFLCIKAKRFDGDPFSGISLRDEHNPDRYLCYELSAKELMYTVGRRGWRNQKFVALDSPGGTIKRLLNDVGVPAQEVHERSWKRY